MMAVFMQTTGTGSVMQNTILYIHLLKEHQGNLLVCLMDFWICFENLGKWLQKLTCLSLLDNNQKRFYQRYPQLDL